MYVTDDTDVSTPIQWLYPSDLPLGPEFGSGIFLTKKLTLKNMILTPKFTRFQILGKEYWFRAGEKFLIQGIFPRVWKIPDPQFQTRKMGPECHIAGAA